MNMNLSPLGRRRESGLLIFFLLLLSGCDSAPSKDLTKPASSEATSSMALPGKNLPVHEAADWPDFRKGVKPLGQSVWFSDHEGHRRVVVAATVCLREGNFGLECLLCRNQTKEHESILATDADAKIIHAGLLLAEAEPGSPVQFQQKNGEVIVVPPKGMTMKVFVQYEDKGRRSTVPAQEWVRNSKTKQPLDEDWVFAGSTFYRNTVEEQKAPVYAATAEGGYICISNVPSAMLDLPIRSPKGLEDRVYEPFTERIPPLDTKVLLILEPQAKGNKVAK